MSAHVGAVYDRPNHEREVIDRTYRGKEREVIDRTYRGKERAVIDRTYRGKERAAIDRTHGCEHARRSLLNYRERVWRSLKYWTIAGSRRYKSS